MEVVERKVKSFPDDLEGRLNSMLNVVNTELKSATLLHLDDSPTEPSEIRVRIRETIGEGYLPIPSGFGAYCHHTLFPIGAVAEEMIRRESVEAIYPAYSLTEAGKIYGRPISALALQYAVENQMSLFQILGNTASHGKTRCPSNRLNILKYLAEKGETGIVNLARSLKLRNGNILNAVLTLQTVGLIDYESTGECKKGKGVIFYLWRDGSKLERVEQVGSERELTIKAARLLKEKGRITAPEATDILGVHLVRRLSEVYSSLVKQGFAIRENDFLGGKKQSSVKIRANESAGFLELTRRFEDILSDKIGRAEAEEIYLDFLNKTDYGEIVREAIELYKKVSPAINKKSREEQTERILDFLRRNPGSRNGEIRDTLKLRSAQNSLTLLVKSGILRKVKEGKETRYYVVEEK